VGYKRRIYLINPGFQIKFSLLICFLMALICLSYPFIVYEILNSILVRYVNKIPELAKDIPRAKETLLLNLLIWQAIITILIFIICIFFSHKVAGPIYKLSKFLKDVKDGQNPGKLFFRNGDYFQEVAEDYNGAFKYIFENHKKDLMYISEVSSYLKNIEMVVPDDKKAVLNEIDKKLSEIQNRFNEL